MGGAHGVLQVHGASALLSPVLLKGQSSLQPRLGLLQVTAQCRCASRLDCCSTLFSRSQAFAHKDLGLGGALAACLTHCSTPCPAGSRPPVARRLNLSHSRSMSGTLPAVNEEPEADSDSSSRHARSVSVGGQDYRANTMFAPQPSNMSPGQAGGAGQQGPGQQQQQQGQGGAPQLPPVPQSPFQDVRALPAGAGEEHVASSPHNGGLGMHLSAMRSKSGPIGPPKRGEASPQPASGAGGGSSR